MLSFFAACLSSLTLWKCSSQGAETPAPEEAGKKGLILRTELASPGYTLYAPLLSKFTYLIDLDGQVVHEWQSEFPPGNSVYLLDDGTLLRCARDESNPIFHGGGIGGRVQLLAWDSTVLWDFAFSSEERMHHHDIAPLPNGNILLIAWEKLSPADALLLGRDKEAIGPEGLWSEGVFEIHPEGKDSGTIVWEWHVWDHLIQDRNPDFANYGSVLDRAERIDINAGHRDEAPLNEAELALEREREKEMRALGYAGGAEDEEEDDAATDPQRRLDADWLHLNAIDYDPHTDRILLSSPRLDEIWIVDHSTSTEEAASSSGGKSGMGGDLMFRWGNPRHYGCGRASDQRLFGQHDAQWIGRGLPGESEILLFNNGNGRPGGEYSSVDQLRLPEVNKGSFVRTKGSAFGPSELAWTYGAAENQRFFSFFISGAQRLPNGNTLICSGAQGRIFEVSATGEIVWEYLNPHGGDVAPSTGRPQAGTPAGPQGRPVAPPPAGPNRRGPGGIDPKALFRATRLAPQHPGLAGLRK